ncbi:hypothetical protein [Methylobacterium nigriterrae]|uniref:hypothetical protein n=1 Tax=Methylobacterium nigriterrae TaxID=3127512 RepID=UPI0030133D14
MRQRIGIRADGAVLRRDALDDARYTAPGAAHPGALRIAAGASLFATLLVLSTRLFMA